jgi:hypothetical protein
MRASKKISGWRWRDFCEYPEDCCGYGASRQATLPAPTIGPEQDRISLNQADP